MEEKHCDKPNCPHPVYKSQGRHDSYYHSKTIPTQEPGGSVQSPSPPGSKSEIEFQNVEDVMKEKKKELAKKGKFTPAKATGSRKIMGIGHFFKVLAEWLNKTICTDPKVQMSDATAAMLEQQFNEAFGIYIEPMIALAGSLFFVFGVPILLNLFGEQIVVKLIMKFKQGISDKLSGDNDNKMSKEKRILSTQDQG